MLVAASIALLAKQKYLRPLTSLGSVMHGLANSFGPILGGLLFDSFCIPYASPPLNAKKPGPN